MKKSVLKKSLKLQLYRETLRTLEQPQLLGIVGGYTVSQIPYSGCHACSLGACTLNLCTNL
jgi:hypothetical protein